MINRLSVAWTFIRRLREIIIIVKSLHHLDSGTSTRAVRVRIRVAVITAGFTRLPIIKRLILIKGRVVKVAVFVVIVISLITNRGER